MHRVLLIEDNPGDARLIREMLAEVPGAPFEIECAGRLAEGLERLLAGGVGRPPPPKNHATHLKAP